MTLATRLLAVLAACHATAALAQSAAAFPSKPIQFIVTSPSGGSNDVFARAIGKRCSDIDRWKKVAASAGIKAD